MFCLYKKIKSWNEVCSAWIICTVLYLFFCKAGEWSSISLLHFFSWELNLCDWLRPMIIVLSWWLLMDHFLFSKLSRFFMVYESVACDIGRAPLDYILKWMFHFLMFGFIEMKNVIMFMINRMGEKRPRSSVDRNCVLHVKEKLKSTSAPSTLFGMSCSARSLRMSWWGRQ